MKTIAQIYEENPELRRVTKAAMHQFRKKLGYWDYAPAKAPTPTTYTKTGEKKIIAWLSENRKFGKSKNFLKVK